MHIARWSQIPTALLLTLACTTMAPGCDPPDGEPPGGDGNDTRPHGSDHGTDDDCETTDEGTGGTSGATDTLTATSTTGAETGEESGETGESGESGESGETGDGPACGDFVGFENGDFAAPDGWTLGAGVSIVDGLLEFGAGAICFDEQAVQEVCMPLFDPAAGPQILRVIDTMIDTTDCAYDCEEPRLSVGYGPEPNFSYMDWAPNTQAICLGESAFNGMVPFTLEALGACQAYKGTLEGIEFDVAAPMQCPTPGFMLNGSFDDSDGAGWLDISPSADFNIIDQGGGDLAGEFEITGGSCNTARALGRVAPGADLVAPGIQFTAVSIGRTFDLIASIDDIAPWHASLIEIGEVEDDYIFCLPPNLAGGSYELQLQVSGGNSCATVTPGTVEVDDFVVGSFPGDC